MTEGSQETIQDTPTGTASEASSNPAPAAPASEAAAGNTETATFTPHDFLPDYLRGKSVEETYNKLSEFYKRHRETVSEPPPATPEEYAYTPSETIKPHLANPDKDPLIAEAKKAAHKHGIPAKAFQGFVDDVLAGFVKEGNLMPPINPAEEHKKLAPEGKYTSDEERVLAGQRALSEITAQLETLHARGTLTDAGFKEMSLLLFTADGATAIRNILNLSDKAAVRLGDGGGVARGETWEEYEKMQADPRYSTRSPDFDKNYRAQVNAYGDRLAAAGITRK